MKKLMMMKMIIIESERAKRTHCCTLIEIFVYIGECGCTLYVGLSGIVRNLIQKSTG